MSLIENALDKLRRVSGPESPAEVTARSGVAAAPSAPKGPAVIVPPAHAYIHKRITLDQKALRAAGYLPDPGLERRFADHYRQIKRPLIERSRAGAADMRLILVSSALPGDGKTFTSINLALSLAGERDLSVLLVDADAPRGRISEVLGVRSEPGLLDALVDESVDVESLILETDIRGLEVLPSGKFVANATELFGSSRMDQISLLFGVHNPRRLVVFDSAPLLVSSEARALLRIPGQVLLVLRAGVTPLQAIKDAIAHVDKKRLQGLILNQTPYKRAAGYYGYPGYGDGDDETSDAD